MTEKLNLGVHCSISGGLENAITAAELLGIDTFQIFTKNQRQWREKIISEDERNSFKKRMNEASIQVACSHASYLINLGSTDETIRSNSILALAGEIIRCYELALPYVVLHPGSNRILNEDETIQQIADGLLTALNHTYDHPTMVLLENTAGQGSALGGKFIHLKKIFERVPSQRLGMCFDTCHAFAAGYDIRTKSGMEDTLEEIEGLYGIEKVKVFHMNDSIGELGSRLDRHEHVGKGKIGLEPFQYLMQKFRHIPKILETDKDNNMDEKNLAVLRSLV